MKNNLITCQMGNNLCNLKLCKINNDEVYLISILRYTSVNVIEDNNLNV